MQVWFPPPIFTKRRLTAAQPPDCDEDLGDCGSPWLAPIYFMSFIFIVVYILLSLFVAVVVNAYSAFQVRGALALSFLCSVHSCDASNSGFLANLPLLPPPFFPPPPPLFSRRTRRAWW